VSIDLEGARCDEEAARLLPWYVSGRLPPAEHERVARHLEHCAICRDDVSHERGVRGLLRGDAPVEYAPQAGLAKTLARIDELGREAPTPVAPAARTVFGAPRRTHAVRWLSAAVLVQALGLGLLGGAFVARKSADAAAPRYVTMSSPASTVAPGAHIRAVFTPSTTLGELKALLAAQQLTIVRGPSEAGAYTLGSIDPRSAASRLDPTIGALRADSRVLFVEPALHDEVGAR
jgi:anti-sigma factor RsiW